MPHSPLDQAAIFMPVLALVGWTLAVMLLIPYRRFKAAFAGQVTARDFKYGESSNVPPEVTIPNRHLINLVEVPVLFYVLCVVLYLTQRVDAASVLLAWGYFAFRVLHSLVHLTYNNVIHRLSVYAVSNLLLAVLWIKALWEIAR